MNPFASVGDYRTAYGDVADEARVYAALAAACEDIRRYCAQSFTFAEEDEITVHGTGRSTLLLPELPVTAVNSVVINAGEDSEEEVTDFRVDTESGLLWRSSSNGCWPGRWPVGFLNITVDYDHGYTTVPAELVQIAVLMARDVIETRAPGISSETIGGYSYSTDPLYSMALATAQTRKTLERLLDRYRLPRIPVA